MNVCVLAVVVAAQIAVFQLVCVAFTRSLFAAFILQMARPTRRVLGQVPVTGYEADVRES